MILRRALLPATILIMTAVCISGCTVNVGNPAPTTVPTTLQTAPPATTAVPTTIVVTTPVPTTKATATTAPTEKEVLHEKGTLTTTSYKTYDFKNLMGYKFVYPKDSFRITIRSDKPVLGYAVNTEQAGQLQGSQLVPHYVSYVKGGIDWGLIDPVMIMEKATDSTKEFTMQDVRPLTYVVDGRWMSYDHNYDNTPPFNYEIIIVKTGGPTQQSFDFAGYDANGSVSSRSVNDAT